MSANSLLSSMHEKNFASLWAVYKNKKKVLFNAPTLLKTPVYGYNELYLQWTIAQFRWIIVAAII